MARKTAKKIKIDSHALIPKHVVCSEKEKQAVFAHYGAQGSDFPRISTNDTGIATLKVKIGDLIKIERNDPNMGKVTFYRVVSDE